MASYEDFNAPFHSPYFFDKANEMMSVFETGDFAAKCADPGKIFKAVRADEKLSVEKIKEKVRTQLLNERLKSYRMQNIGDIMQRYGIKEDNLAL